MLRSLLQGVTMIMQALYEPCRHDRPVSSNTMLLELPGSWQLLGSYLNDLKSLGLHAFLAGRQQLIDVAHRDDAVGAHQAAHLARLCASWVSAHAAVVSGALAC